MPCAITYSHDQLAEQSGTVLPAATIMKVVIPGGSGQVGQILARAMSAEGHEVVILSRSARESAIARYVAWDAMTLGDWAQEIDGADVVINLAGRSVNCRYTDENLKEMMRSRVDSARVVGAAIAATKKPPSLWMQMSTATIYAHRFDAANDETTGIIGGDEPGVPDYWSYSVDIAKAWEAELTAADIPNTRKVALRTAMVMSPDKDGIFDVLQGIARWGLGGTHASGKQYVSWIHDADFVAAISFIIENESIEGAINLTAPNPVPQRAFMRDLRAALNTSVGLPAMKWMLEIGAFFMGSDTELLLKSRRVVPGRLLDAGFKFQQDTWLAAAQDLVARAKA